MCSSPSRPTAVQSRGARSAWRTPWMRKSYRAPSGPGQLISLHLQLTGETLNVGSFSQQSGPPDGSFVAFIADQRGVAGQPLQPTGTATQTPTSSATLQPPTASATPTVLGAITGPTTFTENAPPTEVVTSTTSDVITPTATPSVTATAIGSSPSATTTSTPTIDTLSPTPTGEPTPVETGMPSHQRRPRHWRRSHRPPPLQVPRRRRSRLLPHSSSPSPHRPGRRHPYQPARRPVYPPLPTRRCCRRRAQRPAPSRDSAVAIRQRSARPVRQSSAASRRLVP